MTREVMSWMVLVAAASILLAALTWWLLGLRINRPLPRATVHRVDVGSHFMWRVVISHRYYGKPDRVTWWVRWKDAIKYANEAVHLERMR